MPLQFYVDDLSAVPESVRGEYVAKDGKFQLDVADLDAHFEQRTAGLKSALQKERETNGMLKKHIGMKPEELHAALTNVTADRVATLVKQYEQKHAVEIAALRNELKDTRDFEHSVIRDAVLSEGLRQARATDAGMKLLPELLGNRFRVDAVEGKRSIVILNQDAETAMLCDAGDGSKRAGTFRDLLAETIKKYPGQFESSGAGGGGKQPGGRGGATPTDKTLNRAEWDRLNPYEQAAKMREGYTLHD